MTRETRIPEAAIAEIKAWLPDLHDLWKMLVDRTIHGFFLPEDAQHLHLAAVCLRDLADTLQTAGKALFWAKHDWLHVTVHSEQPDKQFGVHFSRFHFDHAAVALSAASNHMASSMWHLEEEIPKPLGRDYKSAAAAREAWRKRAPHPQSFAILDSLLNDPAWKVVSKYRDRWVHRGMPIIEGEIRQARRRIWRDVKDPPPDVPWFMKRETESGRVCYAVQHGKPEFNMPDLLDKGALALKQLIFAARTFLPLYDAAYAVFYFFFYRC